MQRRSLVQSLGGTLILATQLFKPRSASAGARRVLLQESPLAGYQFHRADSLWPFLAVGTELSLHREHLNPHDPHAIAVWHRGDKLGYVPRRENRTLAQMMDRGERLQAHITRLLDDPNPWRRVRFQVSMDAWPMKIARSF